MYSAISSKAKEKREDKGGRVVINGRMLATDDTVVYGIISKMGCRFNELTRQAELKDGTPITDNDIHDICLYARNQMKTIKEPVIKRVLYSQLTPSYHPFTDFVQKLESMEAKQGVVKKLLSCLEIEDDHHPDYLDKIVKKWFGGIMGTIMGSYSVMALILVGHQGGGKTNFFRSLLPEEFKHYFAESEIAQKTDIMVRMCANLIIYNDEFTSKNKTEASQYRQMVSTDYFTFRKPYGHVDEKRRRIGVCCGSANDPDVISDHTGNRRVIPVRLKRVNAEKLAEIDIYEFYRELLDMHKMNPIWWHLTPDEVKLLNSDTQQNTTIDEFEERVAKYTEADEYGHVSTTEVSRHLAGNDMSYKANIPKLSRALTRMYGSSVQAKVNGSNVRGYKIRLLTYNDFELKKNNEAPF